MLKAHTKESWNRRRFPGGRRTEWTWKEWDLHKEKEGIQCGTGSAAIQGRDEEQGWSAGTASTDSTSSLLLEHNIVLQKVLMPFVLGFNTATAGQQQSSLCVFIHHLKKKNQVYNYFLSQERKNKLPLDKTVKRRVSHTQQDKAVLKMGLRERHLKECQGIDERHQGM